MFAYLVLQQRWPPYDRQILHAHLVPRRLRCDEVQVAEQLAQRLPLDRGQALNQLLVGGNFVGTSRHLGGGHRNETGRRAAEQTLGQVAHEALDCVGHIVFGVVGARYLHAERVRTEQLQQSLDSLLGARLAVDALGHGACVQSNSTRLSIRLDGGGGLSDVHIPCAYTKFTHLSTSTATSSLVSCCSLRAGPLLCATSMMMWRQICDKIYTT